MVLSETYNAEQLRLLNNKAFQLYDTDTSQALALLEEGIGQTRAWYDKADDWATYPTLAAEFAHSLRLLTRIRYRLADYKAAEEPATEALCLYTMLQREAEQLELHNALALLYWKTGRYNEALQQLFTNLDQDQKNGNRSGKSRALNNIGLVYDKLGDYSTALDYLLQSLEIERELGDKKAEYRTIGNIGTIYSQMGDFANALEQHQQCLEYEESENNIEAQGNSLNNIGVVYGRMNHCETSLVYLERCLKLRRERGDKAGEAIALYNTGDMYSALGQHEEALRALQTSLELYGSQGNSDGMARALTSLGTLYWKLRDDAQAIACLQEALALAEGMGAKTLMYTAHEHLYTIYRQQGNTELALAHHEQFHNVREHVFGEANSKRIAALQTRHQVENSRKETEIYRLKNVELANANKQLQIFNLEKNEMLGIVAHDLKNPLNNIRLIARIIHSDIDLLDKNEIRDYSTDIDTMVGRMFELIDNLLDINKIETHGITVHNTECNIGVVIQAVVNNYSRHASEKDINIRFSASPSGTLVVTDPTLVRQVVDNLLSNAVKFSPFHSTVHVRYSANQTVWRVEIEDEGPGMTAEDQCQLFTKFAKLSARPTGNENSTGLGLSIVKKMVEALMGNIRCISAPGKGTLFAAEFPVSLTESRG